jgi:hypothetical protein
MPDDIDLLLRANVALAEMIQELASLYRGSIGNDEMSPYRAEVSQRVALSNVELDGE